MAREAKVKVTVDVEDAKRSMDDVNQRIEKSRSLGANLASNVQNIARGAAAGLAVVGGIADRAAGGGLLSALSSDFLGSAGAGWQGILQGLGLDVGAASQYAGQAGAKRRAVETVRELVGAGGDITDKEIDRLIQEYTNLYLPGAMNQQRVNQRDDIESGNRMGNALNSVDAIDKLTTKMAELIVAIQSWNPFGR